MYYYSDHVPKGYTMKGTSSNQCIIIVIKALVVTTVTLVRFSYPNHTRVHYFDPVSSVSGTN